MVPTVKDPSSDFALCARNGSATLRHQREKREKGKMRQRFWELGGSRMGKAIGVDDKAGDEKKEAEAKEEVRQAYFRVAGLCWRWWWWWDCCCRRWFFLVLAVVRWW